MSANAHFSSSFFHLGLLWHQFSSPPSSVCGWGSSLVSFCLTPESPLGGSRKEKEKEKRFRMLPFRKFCNFMHKTTLDMFLMFIWRYFFYCPLATSCCLCAIRLCAVRTCGEKTNINFRKKKNNGEAGNSAHARRKPLFSLRNQICQPFPTLRTPLTSAFPQFSLSLSRTHFPPSPVRTVTSQKIASKISPTGFYQIFFPPPPSFRCQSLHLRI